MFCGSASACVSLCLWITALMSARSVCARKQDESFFTGSIYRARCASRCLSLHITRISAFFKHSQVRARDRSRVQLPAWGDKYGALVLSLFEISPIISSGRVFPRVRTDSSSSLIVLKYFRTCQGTITDRQIRASLKERYPRTEPDRRTTAH